MPKLRIVPAIEADVPVILEMIQALAEYEKLTHLVVATQDRVRESLFGARPAAEVLLAYWEEQCAGFAVFFPTYSTFLARPGLYLEDLYVKPHLRGKRIGFALLKHLAKLASERGYGRMEWAVLNWNQPSIEFYRKLGAVPLDEWTTYPFTGDALSALAKAGE